VTNVPALRNGLAILRTLAEKQRPMSAAALANELGLPRSTTDHLLAEMRTAKAIEHHKTDQKWALGPLLALLGEAYRRTHTPTDAPAGVVPADPCNTRSSAP